MAIRARTGRACLSATPWLLAGLSLIALPSLSCDGDASVSQRIPEQDMTGALRGEVETFVVDYENGTSERQHFLTLNDGSGTRLQLIFDHEPVLPPSNQIAVWGTRTGSDHLQVDRYLSLDPPAPAVESVTSALVGQPARTRTAAFVLVDLGGGVNVTNAMAQMLVFGRNFSDVYNQMSFGQLQFAGDVIGPLTYALPACATADTNALSTTLKAMIPTRYDHYMWYLGQRTAACAWGGIGAEGNTTTPRADAWFNASTGCTVLVQEVGHNLGMMHSSTIACTGASFADDPTGAGCVGNEYGNRFTPMGSGCGHLNAHDKWYERFFGGCNAVRVTSSATFNLMPLELACNGIQTLQIPMTNTTRTFKPMQGNTAVALKNYYLEYRGPWGLDSAVRTPTVMVLAGDDIRAANRTSVWSWLLDMNPATTNAFDGLTVGQTYTDPAPGGPISITLMAADATKATVRVDIMGGTGDPTCMDGTTVAAPGPTDCGPGSGIVGAGGTGGGAIGGASGSGGRGTGGAATGGATGAGGRGGAAARTGGTTVVATGGTTTTTGGAGVVTGSGGAPTTGSGGAAPGVTGGDVNGGCACSTAPTSNSPLTLLTVLGLSLLLRRRKR